MKKPRRMIFGLLAAAVLSCGCSGAITPSSSQSGGTSNVSSSVNAEIYAVYQLYVQNGGTMTYEEWLASIKGEKGDPGEDGKTPYIGSNGNWWIGEVDTGVKAAGADGKDGASMLLGKGAPLADLGKPGDSYLDIDTWDYYYKTNNGWTKLGNVQGARGEDGIDGETPYIGENGNWWIGDTDTGVKAAGTDGKDGISVTSVTIDENGDLIVTFSDGSVVNAGKVKETVEHTVTFYVFNEVYSTQKVKDGKKASRPSNPYRDGYEFIDWVDGYGDHWVFNGYPITDDIALYARFEEVYSSSSEASSSSSGDWSSSVSSSEASSSVEEPIYYLAGSFNSWKTSEDYAFMKSDEKIDGKDIYTLSVTLTIVDTLKVTDSNSKWYPDGMGNAYNVLANGLYTVYFCPLGGIADWYSGFFKLVLEEEGDESIYVSIDIYIDNFDSDQMQSPQFIY